MPYIKIKLYVCREQKQITMEYRPTDPPYVPYDIEKEEDIIKVNALVSEALLNYSNLTHAKEVFKPFSGGEMWRVEQQERWAAISNRCIRIQKAIYKHYNQFT